MTGDIAVVSASDAGFFDLLQGMVRSLRDRAAGRDFSLYVFDIGMTEAQRRWLLVEGARLRAPEPAIDRDGLPAYLRAFLSRCRIPELFPGHEVYLWIDADAWVQRWQAILSYVEGARRAGFAIAPETDPTYPRDKVLEAHEASFAMFGPECLESLHATGPLNAGVFAGRADAPHWQAWRQLIAANIDKASEPWLRFLLDQTALCLVCKRDDLETEILPPACNWLAHFALPIVSDDGSELLRPLPPHEPLGIVHQTNVTKRSFFPLRRQAGGFLSRTLSYQAHSLLAGHDYVSPGLRVILPDQCFPNMVRGDQRSSDWPYLRRGLPHAWLVDRRIPSWGFLNRDEAHILYNLALGFRGKPGLEIGCLMGWSACHIGLGGVELDVIDPLLANPEVSASVQGSLKAARVLRHVRLAAGRSPGGVHELAKSRPQGWSFFFIDGDHDGEAPLADVKACELYAAPDCAMVFHDLASPHVTNAVIYLKARSWRTRVYHTAQIMAVAWRGEVRSVVHQPDPRIDWQIPEHVMPLLG
jgi:hypothetical protein